MPAIDCLILVDGKSVNLVLEWFRKRKKKAINFPSILFLISHILQKKIAFNK